MGEASKSVRHVLGLSGGKDSAALAIYLKDQGHVPDMEYFFCDTGAELPEVYDFIDRLEDYLGKEVVRLNSGRNFDHHLKRTILTQKIRRQNFNRRIRRCLADGADHRSEMRRAAIGQVIAVYRGDHDMLKTECGDRVRNLLRLFPVKRIGHACLHIAESAGSCAGIAHDHHRGVLLLPAFADIRAAGFFAHRIQTAGAYDPCSFAIAGRAAGRFHPDPFRFSLDRRVRPVSFFRMPESFRFSFARIENGGHKIFRDRLHSA